MVKGLLDFLTDGAHPEAQWLRDHIVWKIVPMLNPDGVANGNSRCFGLRSHHCPKKLLGQRAAGNRGCTMDVLTLIVLKINLN